MTRAADSPNRAQCGGRGRHPRVQPQRRTDSRQLGSDRALRNPAKDRIEIGGVELGEPQPFHIGARESQGITPGDREASHALHRDVALAVSRARVHGLSAKHVDHADHLHRELPTHDTLVECLRT